MNTLYFLILMPFILVPSVSGLPAFPGAEGWGSETPGGRGGKVIIVDNLNADGPGSFRQAMLTAGPRIIVFRVSGVITLTQSILLQAENLSYVTVAGQTSPGGVTITMNNDTPVWQYTGTLFHDAVWRFVRFRLKSDGNDHAFEQYLSHDWIIDHCDFSGGTDECFDACRVHDVTLQWCTIANSGPTGQVYGALLAYNPLYNITFHHNLFAHHRARFPELHWESQAAPDNGMVDYRANVAYDGNGYCISMHSATNDVYVNMVGNTIKHGPWSEAQGSGELTALNMPVVVGYEEDNRFLDYNDTGGVREAGVRMKSTVTTPWTMPEVTTQSSEAAYGLVLERAGAFPRDPMNVRTIREVRSGTGWHQKCDDSLITSGPASPVDTDRDGMPDAWEAAKGLNASDSSDAILDRDIDGYTNIEEYINQLADSLIAAGRPDSSRPPAPTGLNAAAVSHQQVQLTWTAPVDPQGPIMEYWVFRNGVRIAQPALPALMDQGLRENTLYRYTVLAVNQAGLLSDSAVAVSLTTPADTVRPRLQVVAPGDTNINLIFSEPVETASAALASNYTLDNGVTVQSAALLPDTCTVRLAVSPLSSGTLYRLTVANVRDRAAAPNAVSAGTARSFRVAATPLAVDFGATAAANAFSIPGWDTVFKDGYTNNVNAGPGGTAVTVGSTGGYNFQGVEGDTLSCAEYPGVIVTWYNNSGTPVTFNPKISLDSRGRWGNVNLIGGVWDNMGPVTVPANGSTAQKFLVTAALAKKERNFCRVNVSCNYDNNSIVLCDKIQLIEVTDLPPGTESGLHSSFFKPSLTANPNPFTGSVSIVASGLAGKKCGFAIYNASGKSVAAFSDMAGRLEWRPEGLPAGIYFVKMTVENRNLTERILLLK